MQRKFFTFAAGCFAAFSCVICADAQQPGTEPRAFGPNTAQPPAAKDLSLPGMTWESLKNLPPFVGSSWVPADKPADERAYLMQRAYPPLNDEALADAKTIVQSMLRGEEVMPTGTCVFDGMPRAVWYPYPIQFLYAAGNVMIQTHDVVRAAALGGIKHNPDLLDKDKLHAFDPYGEESAAWQGDTLVIDTIGAREDMDTFYGIPNDPDLHVVERYRLIDKNKLELVATIEAPAYFKNPWQIRRTYTRAPEASWATRFCLPKKTGSGT